jgi:curved DNA-binding protein CbpA
MKKVPDPYRELGIPRGATAAQIKAAHRRLAKRFHPDAPDGDTVRFLAVQEAYSLLSDPLRRREWDSQHAPGPVRAGDPGLRSRPRTRGADGRWTRSNGHDAPATRRGRAERASGGRGRSRAAPPTDAGDDDRSARAETAWSASERDPATRSYTWSAESVPWWQDFTPRDRTGAAEPEPSRAEPASDAARSGGARAEAPPAAGGPDRTNEMDVYNRSSGAAWSMAARRYFRRGDEDLPRGGAFRYRGTQVVTGAEARRVAAEEARRATTPPPPPPLAATQPAAPSTPGAPAEPAAAREGDAETDTALGRVGRLFRGR